MITIDPVLRGHIAHLLLGPCQPDQAFMKQRHVFGQHVWCVAFGVDGDHDGSNTFAVTFQKVDGFGHQAEFGRADIRTKGVAEIDEGIVARKIIARELRAGMIGQFKRSANIDIDHHTADSRVLGEIVMTEIEPCSECKDHNNKCDDGNVQLSIHRVRLIPMRVVCNVARRRMCPPVARSSRFRLCQQNGPARKNPLYPRRLTNKLHRKCAIMKHESD